LVDSPTPVRSVVCLPVLAGPRPAGSLILVTLVPKVFRERDIRTIERPLRELGLLIEAVRREAAARISSRETVAMPPLAAPSPGEERPASGAPGSPPARTSLPAEPSRVTDLESEIRRLRAQLAEAEAGAAHEHRAREELEAALARGTSSGQQELQQA